MTTSLRRAAHDRRDVNVFCVLAEGGCWLRFFRAFRTWLAVLHQDRPVYTGGQRTPPADKSPLVRSRPNSVRRFANRPSRPERDAHLDWGRSAGSGT